jgi:hypothetical protein
VVGRKTSSILQRPRALADNIEAILHLGTHIVVVEVDFDIHIVATDIGLGTRIVVAKLRGFDTQGRVEHSAVGMIASLDYPELAYIVVA